MTAKSKKKMETVQWVSPFGTARFPKLSQPDIGGEYSDGKFKTMVVFDEVDIPTVRTVVEAAAKQLWPGEALADLKLPLREFFDKNKEEGTKTSAGWGILAKTKNRPLIMDAMKNPLPAGFKIGGGSTIRIGVAFATYDKTMDVLIIENGNKRMEQVTEKGLTTYLNSVQVRDLQQGGRSDGSEFETVEGGYEYGTGGVETPATADATDL